MTRVRPTLSNQYVLAHIGRAGLGNELFAEARAAEYARREGAVLLPPNWVRIHIGPFLRRERDKRAYWRLFRHSPWRRRMEKFVVLGARRLTSAPRVRIERGVGRRFADLTEPPEWHLSRLIAAARRPVEVHYTPRTYVAVHVRLGDFQRPPIDSEELKSNNTTTPIEWFEAIVHDVREHRPDLPIVIASDGTDQELAPLLAVPGVSRSTARNALDELVLLAHSLAMIGSRSTFTAWGAFLGGTPLLVIAGGNAYRPHDRVWECKRDQNTPDEWLGVLQQQ